MKARYAVGGLMVLIGGILMTSQIFREVPNYIIFGVGLFVLFMGAIGALGEEGK